LARLFYPSLFLATFAVAATLWSQREDRAVLLDLIGVQHASAQSPDPAMMSPNGMNPNGWGYPAMTVPGAGPQGQQSYVAGASMMAPAMSHEAPVRSNLWPATPPPALVQYQKSYANSAPPEMAAQYPGVQAGGPGMGTSISSIPVRQVSAIGEPPAANNGAPQAARATLGMPSPIAPADAYAPPQAGFATPQGSPAAMALSPSAGPVSLPAGPPVAPLGPSSSIPAAGYPVQPVQPQPPGPMNIAPPEAVEIGGAKVIAIVGSEYILAGEILGQVDELLAAKGQGIPEEELTKYRDELVKQRLEKAIQTKLILAEARRKVPPEGMKKIMEKLSEAFEAQEVPKAIEKMQVKDRAELDAKLREVGHSVDRQKRFFAEKNIAQDWVRQQVKADEEVTHEQLLAHYLEHATEYDFESRVRWEQVMVRVSKYPNKQAAWDAIAKAGNRILAGEKFSDVANAMSDGSTAKVGGAHPWTTQGSLSADAVDQALFTLPIGQLSPIIDDGKNLHIVRVIERVQAGRTPFPDVQAEIGNKIKKDRIEKQVHDYVTKLQTSTKIWTIFDGPDTGPTLKGSDFYTPAPTVPPVNADQRNAAPVSDVGPRYR
jgi:parvulin-like peptidyl-prolyl isomerase